MEDKRPVDGIIAYINELILTGELKPGSKYPSERYLSEKFGVSRNTVKKAIQYFELIGLASSKTGSGTYLINRPASLITSIESRQILNVYNFTEIQQTRRILEMGIVKLAAENANQNDKLQLIEAYDRLKQREAHVDTDAAIDAYLEADYDLHKLIASFTRNTLLTELHESLRVGILSMSEVWKKYSDIINVVNPYHEGIVNGILSNDVNAASKAMDEHLYYMEYRIKMARNSEG